MKIETRPLDDHQLQLIVEVDEERVQGALRAAARRIGQRVNIPGFRKGKAPYDVIKRQVGEGALYEAVLDELGQRIYREALDEAKVEPFAAGALQNVKLKPLVLTYTVPLNPEIELGDYRSVRLDYNPPAVADEALERTLEHLREHQALIEPADRLAQVGDVVTLDVHGELRSQTEGEAAERTAPESEGGQELVDEKGISLLVDAKTDWPFAGFVEQLVGLAAGDSKEFDLTIPEDYADEAMRGQVVHFVVNVAEVKSRFLPEWSDDLARSMGDYESLLDLRVKVRQELAKESEGEYRRKYVDDVIDRVVEGATVSYPPQLLDAELDDMLADLDRRLRDQSLSLDDYLKIQKKTREGLRRELEPRARERIKRGLALGKVAELERVRVPADELEERITRLSNIWGQQAAEARQVLSEDRSRSSIQNMLLTDKVIDRLVAIAIGENPPIESETGPAAREAPSPAELQTPSGAPEESLVEGESTSTPVP